ncbi:MAG: NUDIX domain-containing protein [archaeon]
MEQEKKQKVGVGFGVMVIKDGKLLLGKRHEDPKKADSELRGEGTWTMPGGKFEYGESFEAGAARELKEETGMTLKGSKVICVNNDKNEHAHFVTVGFVAKSFSGEPKVMEPDEITEWKWFPINDLPKELFEPSRKVLKCYLTKEFTLND